MGRLSTLFAPERVAVVGATDSEGSVGHAVTTNLLDSFTGEVVAVNPNKETVLGLPCYDNLAGLDDPGSVDVAVVVVPPTVAVEVIENAGEAGIENVVVITAGFGETGSDGAEREKRLREAASEYDLNLVGPNSLGVMSTPVGLNATFGNEMASDGDISFMSQSGAFITAVLDWAAERDVGFKDIVSLGNKAVLDESDFVAEWGDDPDTDVILGYLEDINDGSSFVQTAREVTQETPIVLVKSGRTDAGASAAASHTGAMAGSERAYEAGLDKAGTLRVESVQELFDYAQILAGQPLPDGDEIAIVTNAGGPGVMTTDAVGDSDLQLAQFGDKTFSRLREEMPDEANIYNPVDIIGDAPAERFETALETVLADDNVSMAVVVACPTAVLSFEELSERIVEQQEQFGKPVAATLMGGKSVDAGANVLSEAGVPNYFDPARAVGSLGALKRYREIKATEYEEPTTFDVDRERAREILESGARRGSNRLGVEAMELLDAYGIPTPQGDVVSSPVEAEAVAEEIGDDVVMKIVSPDILHKSDIGGVEVAVPVEEVRDTYEDLVVRARNYQEDATILGVQVQEMVDLDNGVETILGMNRDPQFGPLLLFGLGGIFVEVLEDNTVSVAPVSETEAKGMLDDIDSAPLLRGARGRDPVDEATLVETIQRLSQLVTDFPAIVELDINPLVATPDGVQAVDLRLTLDQEKL
ncbi:acetyltransferase [Haloarcula quadrata]|uniref:acetate--CoA ligase (ADP-forming) n=3 Tax=Haloarcula TaxID=2237 RepID=M0K118_9EURY|nr:MULTISPECIES: acetate--CoA ligase [Haloarcula]EMA11954.1 succinyl-CoA synthetase [Haloarcula californiae ATCC 33799]EMA13530.1 succinyl-CoA synthetase [Haloarcula sinaiiensis ATCC 33800]NHX38307.1 acetate--CoA ligase [Haloarcula sp. R1-2]QUJ73265.1 acetate--CoA ligase [Haloarcula sinaiiensis ATCC 33800]RKS82617.1 acetyltransferase [Haloarcula quadrata]